VPATAPKPKLAETIIGPITFGSICLNNILAFEAPAILAA